MALIKLYEAAAATDLAVVDSIDSFSGAVGFYLARYDCAVLYPSSYLQGAYKIYRDGTFKRIVISGTYYYQKAHDADRDLIMTFPLGGGINSYDDPISMKYDASKPSPLSYASVIVGGSAGNIEVWHGAYYQPAFAAVSVKNLVTGALISTITTTGSITPFSMDRIAITKNGLLVAVDIDNGTYGVVRFYDLTTNTNLYTSTFDRAKFAVIDTVHNNICTIRLSDGKAQVYSFQPAPYVFNPFTVGANRSRYRQDAISGTLLGSNGELIKQWPVGWRLTQPLSGGGFLGDEPVGIGPLGSGGSGGPSAEGHLEHDFTETDDMGVTTNLYCGPGSLDYVGQSATIEAWTGY